MREKARHAVTSLLLVPILLFFAAQAASATDNMYRTANTFWTCFDGTSSIGNGVICETDNAGLSVYFESRVTSFVENATVYELNNEYDTTDLNVSYPSTPQYTGGAETDIIYQINSVNVPTGYSGHTWCDDAIDDTHCDQAYVRFKSVATFDYELACHETGHAVGLVHGSDASPSEADDAADLGCLETPNSGTRTLLSANEVSEINATY